MARTEIDVDAFMQEGLMMKDFMHHNVLTLIGVCFNNDGSPMVILPFMSHGDLLSFIRNENNQPTVKDLLTFGIQVSKLVNYLKNCNCSVLGGRRNGVFVIVEVCPS